MTDNAEQTEFVVTHESITIKEALSIFHELEGKFKGSSYKYNYVAIIEYLGDKYLEATTKTDIQNYRESREKDGVKKSSINREHSVITRLFNAFYEWTGIGRIGRHDLTNLKLPTRNPGELVRKADERNLARTLVLTPMEFFRFCDYAHPRVRIIVILALLTLLRRKNLMMLNKSNFNKALQQLQLVQSKTNVPITIPVSQSISVLIEDTKYDCVCDFTNFRKLFMRAKIESGVHFWLTDLRRTGATQMLLDGVDLKTIQRYLGHTTLVMTEKYIQPPVQHMVTASNKLERRFSESLELSGFSVGEKK